MGDNSINEILEGSHRKLEETKEREISGILKTRMKFKNLKKDLDKGSEGENHQIQRKSIERYKKHCKECEGKIIGLERAIDFVEQSKGNNNQAPPSPGPAPNQQVRPTEGP